MKPDKRRVLGRKRKMREGEATDGSEGGKGRGGGLIRSLRRRANGWRSPTRLHSSSSLQSRRRLLGCLSGKGWRRRRRFFVHRPCCSLRPLSQPQSRGKIYFLFPPVPPPSEPISTPKKEVNTVLWCKRQTRPVRVFGRERERRGPRPGQIGSPYIKRW